MRSLGEVSLRLARRAVELAETRRGVAGVFVVALTVWWLEALVMPLGPGRDLGTYLGAYAQLFQAHPIDLGYALDRMPVATLVMGGLLDLAHGALAEPVVSLLYAGSITAWFLAARTFSTRAALLTFVVLVLYPGYGILFHELSSDSLFAAAFAGWSLLVVRALVRPSAKGFALLGAGVGILTLIRPGNQALLVLAVVPLVLAASWRTRVVSVLAFLVPAAIILGGWALQNGLRYGDYTVARGGNATVPFYRAFVTDRIVRPSNGPASRELARDVQRDLLPKEPYRSYHITLGEFFAEGSPRMQTDLVAMSDRIKGFDTNDVWLRAVGVEAVRAHPGAYARGVASSIWGLLHDGLYWTPSSPGPPAKTVPIASSTQAPGGATEVIDGRRLPKPSEGEPIPAPHEGGVATPDQSIYTVWTSPTEHHLVFVHPGAEQRYVKLHLRMSELGSHLPDRSGGSAAVIRRLNEASRWFPPPILWLLLGLAAFVWRRPHHPVALAVPVLAGLVVIVLAALGLPTETHYSIPVAPAFVVLAGGAVFAPRRALSREGVRHALVRARPSAGAVLAVVAALWAADAYISRMKWAAQGAQTPFDLAVFLRAAGKVMHGHSPYVFHADATYAYPPLLAYLAVPFHAIGHRAGTILWTLLSLAALGLALRLLGVRDWRCYALASFFRFTRSAVDLGTVEPLLLLTVAVGWRLRDTARGLASAALGVALKLFVWPVAVWLAVTRRARGAALVVGFVILFVFVPWAGIGFAGLAHFPHLLRRLSHDEASSSYSVVALAVRAHLPASVGYVLSAVAAVALLAAAWRFARGNDSLFLTFAVFAALAASPIVWIHYFLLLLVPIALARPQLSGLWLVPLAFSFLDETAWPGGDARRLGLALGLTLVVFVWTTVRPLRAAARPRVNVTLPASAQPQTARLPRAH